MIRAMIFDLDGVLVQTEKLKARAYALAVQQIRNLPEPDTQASEAYREVVGAQREVTSRHVMDKLGLEGELRPLMAQYGVSEPWQALTAIRYQIYDKMISDPEVIRDNQWPYTVDLLQVARETGRDAQLIFEFRFCPALQHARELIQDGRLGDIYAFRASYFRSSYVNPDKPLRWKGSFAQSGGGVLNDYMPHLIDMIIWLVGMPTRVTSQMRTFVDNRPAEKEGIERIPIDTDDHAIILNELPGGAIGTIEAGRMISGAANDMNVTICGSKGSLKWDLMDTNYLYFADNTLPASEGGWIQIPTIQRYPDAVIPGADVPPGMMRFHIASMADFLRCTLDG